VFGVLTAGQQPSSSDVTFFKSSHKGLWKAKATLCRQCVFVCRL